MEKVLFDPKYQPQGVAMHCHSHVATSQSTLNDVCNLSHTATEEDVVSATERAGTVAHNHTAHILSTSVFTILTVALCIPHTALAASKLTEIIDAFTTALGTFVPVGLAVAVAVFAWGIVSMMLAGMDDKSLAEGRKRMVWGVVGLFVIVSVWGLVNFLQVLFGVDPGVTSCKSPAVPTGGADDVAGC